MINHAATACLLNIWTLAAPPLTLDDVMSSALQSLPTVESARLAIEKARGSFVSSRGSFDLNLKAEGSADAIGFYDRLDGEVKLEQSTRIWGLELVGGYRNGSDHPAYDGKRVTSDGGELKAGLLLPLLKGGPIDKARLAEALARLDIDLAELELDLVRLQLLQEAGKAYWNWVSAGLQLQVVERLLKLALQRQDFVRAQVESGDRPAILLVDNDRVVADRTRERVKARVTLRKAAIKLSIFWRNEQGDPIIPEPDRLPSLPEPVTMTQLDLEQALTAELPRRPDVQQLQVLRTKLRQELRLATNSILPKLDLEVMASKELGEKRSYGSPNDFESKNETEVGLGLSFAFPVQIRAARGKAASLRASIGSLDQKARFLRDKLRAAVRQAWVDVRASREQAALAAETAQLTQTLQEAERERFELGQSDIFILNLREESAAKAQSKLVDTTINVQTARLDFWTAAGVSWERLSAREGN